MAETWTVRRLLEWTTGFFSRKQVQSPRLSAELLLSHVLAAPRIKLYTNYERPLADAELSTYRDLVRRTAEQEPIAYLTGKAHFFNLEFEVGRDVLIPRPDTETLVENVLQLARHEAGFETPRVLDLCTGSGCVAIAVVKHLKNATAFAVDVSPPAVAVARRNADRLGVADRLTIEEGDLYAPLETAVDPRPFDLIVSNPPYIPTGQIDSLDASVKDYEPRLALDGGLDGLSVFRRILAGAPERLRPGGRIFLEIAFDQGEAARQVMADAPDFEDARVLKDYGGNDRVVTGRRKTPT